VKCGFHGRPGCFVGWGEFVIPPDLSFAAMFEMFVEGVDALFIDSVILELRAF
jgi:hypothetical protein